MIKRIISCMKGQTGEAIIEATIIFPIVLFCVFTTIDFGISIYQQELVTATANETAASVSRIYHSYGTKDPVYNYTDLEDLEKMNSYRKFLYSGLRDYSMENFAEALAKMNLDKWSLYKTDESSSENKIEINIEKSSKKINVTITQVYIYGRCE